MTRRIQPFSAIPHRQSLAVTLTAIAALIVSACGQSNAPAGMAQGAGAPPEVGVFTVETQTVPVTSELSGRTVANVIAEIRPQIGGIVQKRLFREGGDVKAGELLYQLEHYIYHAGYGPTNETLGRMIRELFGEHPGLAVADAKGGTHVLERTARSTRINVKS